MLGIEGLRTSGERTENGSLHRRQVRPPAAVFVGLDVTGTADERDAEAREVDVLGVDTANGAIGVNP
jgi:hypothetical protein